MLDFQPLLARFVDDLLRVIREASLDELWQVLGNGQADPPAKRPRVRASKPRGRARPAARPTPRKPARRPRATAAREEIPEPASSAEITDPEMLLAAAASEAPSRTPARPHAAPASREEGTPPSGEKPAESGTVALRGGERLARAPERGVVIRRQKRA